MRLFTFDFENIFVWLMVFFGGCFSYTPPQPVEVQTPESVTTQITREENLVIEIKNENTVQFIFTDQEGNLSYREVKNELAALKNVIKELIDKAGGKENLNIALKSLPTTKHKDYSKVIEALKANEIYKFSLITIPE
jgi:biopolymer transport protein ExbD